LEATIYIFKDIPFNKHITTIFYWLKPLAGYQINLVDRQPHL